MPRPLPPDPFQPLPDDDAPRDAAGGPLDAEDDQSAAGAEGRRSFRQTVRVPLALLAAFAGVAVAAFAVTGGEMGPAEAPAPEAADGGVVPLDPGDPYTFRGLDIPPDRLYGRYFAGAFAGLPADADVSENHLADFRWRLEMYRKAYGVDDNFTIRVLDDRTGKTLETLQLRGERDRYNGTGQASWDEVNRKRRAATTELRRKWQAYGVPREHIVIRWGYANQTLEARERDARYITYEVNLARRLGLSLLATEIGTVETFNQDRLVSSAGARSRYQMMPDILRMFDVETYDLRTRGGRTVEVQEEHHPLLAMEPSLMLVRAYSNAVGHDLPGISAYHTGPGNIFKLYREYLRANPGRVRAGGQHVSDAYMWGVTDGFEAVDAVSSFGPHSRAYVLKAYGSLRATEDQLIDPSETVQAERVQVRPGAAVWLSDLLAALAPHERRLDWGPIEGETVYARFRDLNPHMDLPRADGEGVPRGGDVRLVATSGGDPVRFFLPAGSASVLRRVGLDVLGEVEPFDETTFLLGEGERTGVDRAYDRLVRDTGQFGFTRENQRRLFRIHDQLQALAAQNPDSRYRQTQAKIARIHKSVWQTRTFRDLVASAETLLSVDPRARDGEPVADAPRRAPDMEPVAPRPPRPIQD
jgi:hypothetical protein